MALRSPLTVQPYDYISDSTGRPLDYGQIYIGVANQDPEFYQIPVYLDAAMTKPIDQPIRTNDGFVDFAGSLSELYASAEVYSVKVLDKQGRKVLYKGDMTRKNLMSDALADLNQSIIDTQTAAQITLNAAVNSANTEVAQTVSLATAAIDTATTKSNKAATDADAAIKTLFENGGLPATPFKTKALMTASALANDKYAMVTDDTVNNGLYVKTAGAWVKSEYDPLAQSKTYTEMLTSEVKNDVVSINNWVEELSNKTSKAYSFIGELHKTDQNSDIIPVLVDDNNKVLIGYDKYNDKAILAGVDDEKEKPTIGVSSVRKKLKKLTQAPLNHFLFYGQSLSVGSKAGSAISTEQPYSNLTFNTYPRMLIEPTGVIPLVEVKDEEGNTKGQGETICSAASNYAVRDIAKNSNILPSEVSIFSSTGGLGATSINILKKNKATYQKLMTHISNAKNLSAIDGYKVTMFGFLQGETDASTSKTPYAQYKADLVQLISDVDSDAKQITGQTDDVEGLIYQVSAYVNTLSDTALAQLDASMENDNIHLVTPVFFFEHSADNLHLTAKGYKHLGAYFGRAYKQRVLDSVEPDVIKPISASINGDTVTVKFSVPRLPLVLDHTTLPSTLNSGFTVKTLVGVNIEITSVKTDGDTVVIKLANSPTSEVEVRYALDNKGEGFAVLQSASGNLRDSTDDTIEVSGDVLPMYHVCPHFKLKAFADKGI